MGCSKHTQRVCSATALLPAPCPPASAGRAARHPGGSVWPAAPRAWEPKRGPPSPIPPSDAGVQTEAACMDVHEPNVRGAALFSPSHSTPCSATSRSSTSSSSPSRRPSSVSVDAPHARACAAPCAVLRSPLLLSPRCPCARSPSCSASAQGPQACPEPAGGALHGNVWLNMGRLARGLLTGRCGGGAARATDAARPLSSRGTHAARLRYHSG